MTVHRVSVSLNEAKYTQLVQAAGLLGIKPTTAAHRSIKHGLVALSKEAQAVTSQLHSLQFSQQFYPSETPTKPRQAAEQAKEPAKPKNNTQRKHEQRLAREQAKKAKKQKTAWA